MRSYLCSLLVAVLLVLPSAPARADFAQASQIVGTVLTIVGVATGNAALVNYGYGLIAAGPARYGLAARRRKKRRAPASSESAEVRS